MVDEEEKMPERVRGQPLPKGRRSRPGRRADKPAMLDVAISERFNLKMKCRCRLAAGTASCHSSNNLTVQIFSTAAGASATRAE